MIASSYQALLRFTCIVHSHVLLYLSLAWTSPTSIAWTAAARLARPAPPTRGLRAPSCRQWRSAHHTSYPRRSPRPARLRIRAALTRPAEWRPCMSRMSCSVRGEDAVVQLLGNTCRFWCRINVFKFYLHNIHSGFTCFWEGLKTVKRISRLLRIFKNMLKIVN